MQGGKEHASQPQFIVLDEGSRASRSKSTATSTGLSSSRENTPWADGSECSTTQLSVSQPTDQDPPSRSSVESPSESTSELYWEVLAKCNSLIKRYCKGQISKASVYVEIQSNLARALRNDRTRSDAAFGLFIATVKSHDMEAGAVSNRGKAFKQMQCTPSPAKVGATMIQPPYVIQKTCPTASSITSTTRNLYQI